MSTIYLGLIRIHDMKCNHTGHRNEHLVRDIPDVPPWLWTRTVP